MTMFINIIGTPMIVFLFQIIRWLNRKCDRGCTNDYRKTKKLTQDDLIKLYTGPEFLVEMRYASIINVILITMMYSSGLPVLYLSAIIHLFLLYWIDKTWRNN